VKITIFGGTGPTGRLLVEDALAAGHEVTVFARSPQKVAIADQRLRVVAGELTDAAAVRAAIEGADAVISVLGPHAARVPGTPITDGMRNIVVAMEGLGVRRLIATSTASASDSRDRRSLFVRVAVAGLRTFLRLAYDEVVGQAAVIRGSDLDWTLVRVPGLTNGPVTSVRAGYLGAGKVGFLISRASLAAFLLAQAVDPTWVGGAPAISGS
jgi:putative NADH-flavin reductase